MYQIVLTLPTLYPKVYKPTLRNTSAHTQTCRLIKLVGSTASKDCNDLKKKSNLAHSYARDGFIKSESESPSAVVLSRCHTKPSINTARPLVVPFNGKVRVGCAGFSSQEGSLCWNTKLKKWFFKNSSISTISNSNVEHSFPSFRTETLKSCLIHALIILIERFYRVIKIEKLRVYFIGFYSHSDPWKFSLNFTL